MFTLAFINKVLAQLLLACPMGKVWKAGENFCILDCKYGCVVLFAHKPSCVELICRPFIMWEVVLISPFSGSGGVECDFFLLLLSLSSPFFLWCQCSMLVFQGSLVEIYLLTGPWLLFRPSAWYLRFFVQGLVKGGNGYFGVGCIVRTFYCWSFCAINAFRWSLVCGCLCDALETFDGWTDLPQGSFIVVFPFHGFCCPSEMVSARFDCLQANQLVGVAIPTTTRQFRWP